MTGPIALGLALLVACLAAPAGAATAAKQQPAPQATTTTAKQKPVATGAMAGAKNTATVSARSATVAAAGAKNTATVSDRPVTAAAAGAKQDTAAADARSATGPRTLEDIHIEGEIPVPQVLFITARDQRRLTQFHHRRYLKSGLKVGEQAILPSRIALARTRPTDAGPR